jgi:hypothetical protein
VTRIIAASRSPSGGGGSGGALSRVHGHLSLARHLGNVVFQHNRYQANRECDARPPFQSRHSGADSTQQPLARRLERAVDYRRATRVVFESSVFLTGASTRPNGLASVSKAPARPMELFGWLPTMSANSAGELRPIILENGDMVWNEPGSSRDRSTPKQRA